MFTLPNAAVVVGLLVLLLIGSTPIPPIPRPTGSDCVAWVKTEKSGRFFNCRDTLLSLAWREI